MRRVRREVAARPGVVLAAVVAAAVAIVALHVRAYPEVSPIDELQHIDYLQKAATGELVGRGEKVDEPAMREEACRGLDAPVPVPSCDAPTLDPDDFQEEGYNTAYVHPPTYYAVSGVLARLGRAVAGLDSLVTAARLTGALWLAAACALLWCALRDLRTSPAARAALLVILITSPTVLHATATVNPDAMALAAGAAVLLGVLRWESGRWPLWVPAAMAALAVAVKSTNIVAVGAALLYLAARYGQRLLAERRAEAPTDTAGDPADGTQRAGTASARETMLRAGGMLLAGVVVVSLAWIAGQAVLAEGPGEDIPMIERYSVDSVSLKQVVGQLGAGVSPLQQPYVPEVLRTKRVLSAITVVDAALVAGVVIGAVYAARGSRHQALGVASLVTMVAVGPLFVLVNFVFSGTFVEIPARYGLSMVPFALAAASVALQRRALLVGTGAYALWLLAVTAWPLATA